jgi:SAM-dependent methyltransferase
VSDTGAVHAEVPVRLLPPGRPLRARLRIDGAHFAVLPGVHQGENATFSGQLPPQGHDRMRLVVLEEVESGRALVSARVPPGPPRLNAHGLAAHRVFDPAAPPLSSLPWIEFDGARLVISGACLPPGGDPGALSVEAEPGLAVSLDYGLPSPAFGGHYWYWPNAEHSGLRLTVDLARSTSLSGTFSVRLAWPGSSGDWPDRGRIWIPRDFADFLNFPADVTQLGRVQTWSTDRTVANTGYNAFRAFESLLARHDVVARPGSTLLDWGCGHGRVTRHFIRHWPEVRVLGADIDEENIAWCARHLPGGRFSVAPLWPPLGLGDASVDVVIGLSVMTHLSADAQRAWLAELARILKPGGIAIVTFGGSGAAAYASIHHDTAWWERLQLQGFDDSLPDPALHGKISDGAYYRVTHQLASQVRADWVEHFEVSEIVSQAFGYQDAAILRPRR